MAKPDASSETVPESFEVRIHPVALRPAVPVHRLIEIVRRYVVIIAVRPHNLTRGAGRLSELSIPLFEPTRFNIRTVLVGSVFDITIDIKCDGEHIAVHRVVSKTLAGVALHAWFVSPTSLVWSCKPTLWFVGWVAGIPNAVASFRAAAGAVVIITALP